MDTESKDGEAAKEEGEPPPLSARHDGDGGGGLDPLHEDHVTELAIHAAHHLTALWFSCNSDGLGSGWCLSPSNYTASSWLVRPASALPASANPGPRLIQMVSIAA